MRRTRRTRSKLAADERAGRTGQCPRPGHASDSFQSVFGRRVGCHQPPPAATSRRVAEGGRRWPRPVRVQAGPNGGPVVLQTDEFGRNERVLHRRECGSCDSHWLVRRTLSAPLQPAVEAEVAPRAETHRAPDRAAWAPRLLDDHDCPSVWQVPLPAGMRPSFRCCGLPGYTRRARSGHALARGQVVP